MGVAKWTVSSSSQSGGSSWPAQNGLNHRHTDTDPRTAHTRWRRRCLMPPRCAAEASGSRCCRCCCSPCTRRPPPRCAASPPRWAPPFQPSICRAPPPGPARRSRSWRQSSARACRSRCAPRGVHSSPAACARRRAHARLRRRVATRAHSLPDGGAPALLPLLLLLMMMIISIRAQALVDAIALKAGVPKKTAALLLGATLDVIVDSVCDGSRVRCRQSRARAPCSGMALPCARMATSESGSTQRSSAAAPAPSAAPLAFSPAARACPRADRRCLSWALARSPQRSVPSAWLAIRRRESSSWVRAAPGLACCVSARSAPAARGAATPRPSPPAPHRPPPPPPPHTLTPPSRPHQPP